MPMIIIHDYPDISKVPATYTKFTMDYSLVPPSFGLDMRYLEAYVSFIATCSSKKTYR